jgi:hypothetical protein
MAMLEDLLNGHDADSLVRAVFDTYAAGGDKAVIGLMDLLDEAQLVDIITIAGEASERSLDPLAGLAVGKLNLSKRSGEEDRGGKRGLTFLGSQKVPVWRVRRLTLTRDAP